MKVRLRQPMVGRYGAFHAKAVVDLPTAYAVTLCKNGQADPVKGADVETASVSQPETASLDYPKHVGGGWYELSDGSKVQGKAEAEEAEAEL